MTRGAIYPAIAVIAALAVCAVILLVMGLDPVLAYQKLFQGAFGSKNAISETLTHAIPLLLCALSFAVGVQGGLINLGATGQLYIGALAGGAVGIYLHLPPILHIPLILVVGFIAGGAYGLLIAFLKNRFGVSELISTIMMNYVAIYLLNYLVTGPMKDTSSANNLPQSALIATTAKLSIILPGTRLHAGLYLAIAALLFYYLFFYKTPLGYQIRVGGLNPDAAHYAGFSIEKNNYVTMFLAGGFAGLAGCVQIMSVQSRLIHAFAKELGFSGVAVALLGNNTPLGIAISSILFAGLDGGAAKMQTLAKVPNAVVYMLQGIILMFVVGQEMFNLFHRRQRRAGIKKEAAT
ncbi:MAG: ABC transporter permease [Candidatus Promineofilum sp.]|nr:ABC transporter permease [Promineifilum sp.]